MDEARRDIPFRRHELGFFVPEQPAAGEPQRPSHIITYLTYSELTGRDPLTEAEIVARLRELSAADCMNSLAQIGVRLHEENDPAEYENVQRGLVQLVAGDGPLGKGLSESLADARWGAVFCEQQLVHLARLVVLHADTRPHDDFSGGALYDEWVTCLIGVTDLLDADLEVSNDEQRLSWEVRQCELNHSEDQLLVRALHNDIYLVLWPEVQSEQADAANEAFVRKTGMSIADYFTVATAVAARFSTLARNGPSLPAIAPATYFASTQLEEETWQAFFRLNARTLDDLREELRREEARYGPTTYGSLTFERFPLVEIEPCRCQ